MTTSGPAQTIQAEMHEGTMSGLGELLQLPTERALDEVLDNARRSGATRIRITTDKRTVTVEDNGRGIADPQLLLSFGRSGWTPESEGIGFSALAAHEPEVRSRTEDGAGWRVSLRNEHFAGSTPAPIEATDEAPAPNGTAVTLAYPDAGSRDQEIDRAIANLPGLVTINGRMAENRDHLANCIYIHREDGVRIGVEHFNHLFHGRGTVNFHGQVASEGRMPRVHCDGQTWMTRADVVDNPTLRAQPAGQGRNREERSLEATTAKRREGAVHGDGPRRRDQGGLPDAQECRAVGGGAPAAAVAPGRVAAGGRRPQRPVRDQAAGQNGRSDRERGRRGKLPRARRRTGDRAGLEAVERREGATGPGEQGT